MSLWFIVFKRLEAPKYGAGAKLVLIDACRDNFLATSSKRATRSLSRDFGRAPHCIWAGRVDHGRLARRRVAVGHGGVLQ